LFVGGFPQVDVVGHSSKQLTKLVGSGPEDRTNRPWSEPHVQEHGSEQVADGEAIATVIWKIVERGPGERAGRVEEHADELLRGGAIRASIRVTISVMRHASVDERSGCCCV
jgi:hypothetical protein